MNVTLVVCVCLGGFGRHGGNESLRVRYCDPCVQAVLVNPCCETVDPCQPVATKKVMAAYAPDPAESLSAEYVPAIDYGLAYGDPSLPVGYAGQALGYGGLGGGYGGLGGGIGWGNGQGAPGRGFGFVGGTGGGGGGGRGNGGGGGGGGGQVQDVINVNVSTGDVNVSQNQTQSQGQSQYQEQNQNQNQNQNGGNCGCEPSNVPLPPSAWIALVGCVALVGARRKGLLR